MHKTIEIIPSVFQGPGRDGDFSWMIEQPQYDGALFVFNDNERQFDDFVSGTAVGGGNAVVRPYQAARPRAAGVPTGIGYDSLDDHARSVIDRAVARIQALLETGRYDQLIYSASPTDPNRLGHGIFQVGEDVLEYIPARLRAAVAAAEAALNG